MNELKKIKLNQFDLIYVSSALPDTMIEKYFNNSYQFFPHQSQKYNRLLIEGLAKNGIRVNALSILPITRNITRKIIIDKNNSYQNKALYSTMRLINLPILKNLTIFFSILFILIKNNKETPVVIDLLNKTATIAVYIAKKVKKNYVIGLLTDIPSFNTDKYNDNLQLTKLQKKIFSSFDHFILLTNEMTKLHKKFENNHTIIEGICDETLEVTYLNKYEGCNCLYSGTLAKVYGIDNLIQAFMSKDLEKVNLYIYGEGDYREEIERVSLSHKNIIYKGSVSNKEIIIEQTKVNLLINPRPVEGMFTKYSFPSKIIEYMASGTPTLTSDLSGIPIEYKKYLLLLKSTSVEDIILSVIDFFKYDKYEAFMIGKNAREFVINHKTSQKQAKKILNILVKKSKIQKT